MFYNTLMDTIARLLTQPTRYLICVIGFSLLVAVMVQRYPKWSYWFVGVFDGKFVVGWFASEYSRDQVATIFLLTELDGPVLISLGCH